MKHDPADPHWLRPRPLRALVRPRVDAAVLDALPDRLRRHAGPDQAVPAARLADAGPPRVRPRPRRRDDHGSARPGHLATPSAWRSPSACWPPASTATVTRSSTTTRTSSAPTATSMEGISAEASSFAGHLGLGKLIGFYDDNHITIEGDTELSFSEDIGARFEAYGWHVQNLHEEIDARPRSRRRWRPRATSRTARRWSSPAPTSRTARRTSRTRTGRTARRSATRRSGHEGGLRLTRATSRSSCPRRRSSTSASARPRPPAAGRLGRGVRAVSRRVQRRGRRARPPAGARARPTAAATTSRRRGPTTA